MKQARKIANEGALGIGQRLRELATRSGSEVRDAEARAAARPATNGARTLRAIRDKAVDLIWKHGFEGANLRMLAASVGIKAASLYNHIDSKQDLLFELIRDTTLELADLTERALEGITDPVEQMRRFIDVFLDYSITHRKAGSVFVTEMRRLNPRNYKIISTIQQGYHDYVREIIERGVAAGEFNVKDPDVAAFAIAQIIMGITQWYDPKKRLSPEKLKQVYTDLLLSMLGAKP